MPYITFDRREEIEAGDAPANVGDLTFVLYLTLVKYLHRNRRQGISPRFQDLAECLGALASAHSEFQRNIVTPYEQEKQLTNGDVEA